MPRILMTGASGGIGTSLRKLLPPIYPDLLLSDLKAPADLGRNEKFKAAELSDPAQVEAICEGVDGILHFGGHSVEGPWDSILQSNIIGGYNLFEAARKKGVKRVVFASSNHAVGFYPRHHRIGTDVTARPDSRYGVSKVFGEAVGALYADKHGLKVTCIRIGNFGDMPLDRRRLSIWLKPEDLVQSLQDYMNLTLPMRAKNLADKEGLALSRRQHELMIELLGGRDSWALAQLCVDHMQFSKSDYLGRIGADQKD